MASIICYNDPMVEDTPLREPLVIAFVTDLMTTARIKAVVEKQGYEFKVIDSSLTKVEEAAAPIGEPTSGPEVELFDRITRWSPALILVDIGDGTLPWRHWLRRLKSSPASRRFPCICFGPHVQKDLLTEAESLGVELVVGRSRFFSDLANILAEHALVQDSMLIEASCQEALGKPALSGLQAFNDGDYFEAHEYLEEAWNADRTAGRAFYRALIQIAVAYLQITRRNYRGAYKMFLRSRQWLRKLPDLCHGVDIKLLRDDSSRVYNELMRLGEDAIDDFDLSLLKPLELREQ